MAFFQDPARQPFLRAPPVVLWLIALLVAIHALLTFFFAAHANEIYVTYGFIPARYSTTFLTRTGVNPGNLLDQALPFVTYIFLHGSWAHVLINCVWLLAFGAVVARRFGTALFLGFFIVCGVAGAALHLAVYWGTTAPVIGASAGISGLMGAAFRMLPFGPRRPSDAPLEPLLSTRILVWSAIWALLNVGAGLTGFGGGPGVNFVAWVAHLGGYFAGLILAGPFDAWARRRGASVP
ncbi:MAG TPA: rhomboid family intramembrane serine protease [Rhizomicrobium sp.]